MSLQTPGIRTHIPQIGSGKIIISAVPGQVIVKDRIDAQGKRFSGRVLPRFAATGGGLILSLFFLFRNNHPGDSFPGRRDALFSTFSRRPRATYFPDSGALPLIGASYRRVKNSVHSNGNVLK